MTDETTKRELAVPQWLTTAEACERIGIDKSTLSRWVQLGQIAYAMKLPGRSGPFLFDPVEVERARVNYQAQKAS